ncbi:hypothetical protein DFQ29_006797, partial [Apophysomyces sp. BC1021]
TIHIIVQRPLVDVSKIDIAYENIEPELLRIVEEASRNLKTHSVDPRAVEEYQRKALGSFYRRPLPYATTEDAIYLQMLGNMLGREPMTEGDHTLRKIMERDTRTRQYSIVAIVGRSGSGKTATVIELAKHHFVIYVLCIDPRSNQPSRFTDRNFVKLANDVETIYSELANLKEYRDLPYLDSRMKLLAVRRVDVEFLARLILLWILFRKDPQLTPEQFFREQLNGGIDTVEALVEKLLQYDSDTINLMLQHVEEHLLEDYLGDQGLAIALDEAQVAEHDILAGKLISSQALAYRHIWKLEGDVLHEARRGFFTPLWAALSFRRATLIALGTSLSLRDSDYGRIVIDGPTRLKSIMRFPSFNEQDQRAMLSEVIDLSGCDIPAAKWRMLTGRAHFSIRVVERLLTFNHSDQNSKQRRLENAFDEAISQIKTDLEHHMQVLITSDRSGEIVKLLSRMVIAHKLWNGKIWFENKTSANFIQKSLCSLQNEYNTSFTIDEPLVAEVVEKKLRELDVDSAFVQYLDQFNRLIENIGVTSTANGDMLGLLIRRSLQRFNGIELVELPFLKGINLPSWCIGLKLQIDEINTARGFGFSDEGIKADLEFLKTPPPNKMLIEQYGTRREGIWFFNDHYAGSISIKLHTKSLCEYERWRIEPSSNIRDSFLQSDSTSLTSSLQKIRDEFVASGVPASIKGILRIHLEFPEVWGIRSATRVETNPTTGNEDIMVFIDSTNMDEFFYEGISEHAKKEVAAKPSSSSGGKKAKKKWSAKKVKDKANNMVVLDKPTYERLFKEVPTYKMISQSVLVDRLRLNGSLARVAIRELEAQGLIKPLSRHASQVIYTRATGGANEAREE